MQKYLVLFFLLVSISLSAYNVGDTVNDLTWVDDAGESHGIYELVDSGRAVLLFFGESW
jgi:hypothetical protein